MYSSSGEIEIGATLRKARQDLGVTLDDVEYETKIRKRYLAALESEDYAALPSAVYARGFLKTYANYLGLDGEDLSQELKGRWDALQERQRREAAPKQGRPRSQRARGASSRDASRDNSRGLSARRASRASYRRISPAAMLGLVFALVLVAAAFSGLYWVGQNSRVAQEDPSPPESPNERAAQPEQPEEQTPGDGGRTPGVTSGDGTGEERTDVVTDITGDSASPPELVRVTVTVGQMPAWLNVQADGDVLFEQVAQPGFSQTFEAGSRVSIWTGDAGAVRLEVNGQDYGAIGEPGQVERRVFTLKPAQG
ncbi:MAG: RodZ domain-containing protein [Rubrobacteraceae bacterium]